MMLRRRGRRSRVVMLVVSCVAIELGVLGCTVPLNAE